MIRFRWGVSLVVPLLLVPTVYIALASAAPAAESKGRSGAVPVAPAAATPSSCVPSLEKSINPSIIPLGDSVAASLVVSATCAAKMLPVDLVFVVDESFSMTKQRGGGDPGLDPTPTDDPGPGPGGTPDPGGGGIPTREPGEGGEPAFCNQNPGGEIQPTATRTPRFPRRTPTSDPGGAEPTEPAEAAGAEDLIKEEQAWVEDFLGEPIIQRDLQSDRLHIGFVSFSENAKIKQPLTNTASKITTAVNRMRGSDYTFVSSGMQEASRQLTGSGSRPDPNRVKLIILMSDFQFCLRDMRMVRDETQVITIGFGRGLNRRNHRDMASERELALEKSDLPEVIRLYDEILAPPQPIKLDHVTVRDRLMDNMRLVPGSINPITVTVTGQLLEWQFDNPLLPIRLSYAVEPLDSGFLPISASADAGWTDSDGLLGNAAFPQVEVEVLPMTATPTPPPTYTPTPTNTPTATYTPTPTATFTPLPTATPVPRPVYLPILFRNWPEVKPCVPEEQTIDVALIIDTSNSMKDPTRAGGKRKIDAAVEAAIEIVSLLKPTDQAAVIGFNATATVAATLSGDKAALTAALQALPNTQAGGTQIDLGLVAGLAELLSTRHVAANNRSIILVTDGAQSVGQEQAVRDAAAAIKATGIKIVSVGLGPDIDVALLTEVATAPNLFYRAPAAEDLLRIYREVARLIPCP